MKIFLSQVMKDRSDSEILNERNKAIEELKKEYPDAEFIDSFIKEDYKHPVQYLGASLIMLGTADLAVFLDGWRYGRGCRVEHEACCQYNIPVKYMSKED
jgi:hypothetical protein